MTIEECALAQRRGRRAAAARRRLLRRARLRSRQALQLGHAVCSGRSTALTVGIIIGSGLGYVLGGVLGCTTVTRRRPHRGQPAPESRPRLVAGSFGGVIGVLVGGRLSHGGSSCCWQPFLAFPLFGFVVLVIGLSRLSASGHQREEMLAMFAGARVWRPAAPARRLCLASSTRRSRSTGASSTWCAPASSTAVWSRARARRAPRAGRRGRRPASGQGTSWAARTSRRLKREPGVNVEVLDDEVPAVPEVDAKLVRICLDPAPPC